MIIPQFVGLDPSLPPAVLYALPVMCAVYAGRRQSHREVLAAVQWAIATVLMISLAATLVIPAVTLGPAGMEQRIPFLDTRFWGLGSGPNSIAPLALVQLLLQIQQPRRHSVIWLFANLIAALAALVVLIWAQSQTTWAAAVIALPVILTRRAFDSEIAGTRFKAHNVVIGLTLAVFALAYVGTELIRTDVFSAIADRLPGSRSEIWRSSGLETATAIGDQVMTGRGKIWQIAVDVWQGNPWFGFGAHAWAADFRSYYDINAGVHAHNQWLQALSVSGLIGFSALMIYLVMLGSFAWKTSSASRGLTLGILLVILIRAIAEVPLETSALTTADFVTHLLLLYTIMAYTARTRSTT